MPEFHPLEIELCRKIYEDHGCADFDVAARISSGVGVTIVQGARPVGWWSVVVDELCYSAFPRFAPLVVARCTDHAVKATAAMARKRLWRKPLEATCGLVQIDRSAVGSAALPDDDHATTNDRAIAPHDQVQR